MNLLLVIFLMQALPSATVSHAVTIDPEHTLLLIGGRKMDYPAQGEYGMNIVSLGPGESLRLAISEKSGGTWEVGDPSVGLNALFSARVARVDRSSVVIERNGTGDYGIASPSLKYFLDLTARRVLKTVPLDNPAASVVRVQLVGNRVCASVRTRETAFTSCGDEAGQTIVAQLGPPGNLPDPVSYPVSDSYHRFPSPYRSPLTMNSRGRDRSASGRAIQGVPRSTSELAATRSAASAFGLERHFMTAKESRVSAVLAISIHTLNGSPCFRFQSSQIGLYPPWFVETDVVWAALVTYPEGATRSGGLIRYNLSTRSVTRYDLPDTALTMFRRNDALFIGASNGLYILRNNRLTRFRFEPDLDGKFEPVRDPIP